LKQHDKPESMSPLADTADTLKLELARCRSELAQARAQAKAMADVFMHLADATFIVERDATIIDANPAACALLGYSREALLRMYPWDFVISASRDEILNLTQGLLPGEVATVQRVYRRHDQTQLLIDLRLIRCNLGGRDLIMVSCRDVTERAQAETQLRRSELSLATAQCLSATGSFSWFPLSGEITCSSETRRMCGLAPEQTPDLKTMLALVHPDDLEMLRNTLIQAQQDIRVKFRLCQSDGRLRHLEVVARAVQNDSGDTLEWAGAVMDVTEHQRTQETIRHAKARFEGILKIADDAIISTDAHQRISLFNQGAEKVFGYPQDEVIGQPLGLLLPQRLQPPHAAHVAAFAQSAEVTRGMGERREVLGLRKDGREFPAEASISRLDLSGEQIFTVILRDITERRCAAEALRAAGQLARGQVEALTHTVDALAIESEPERIAEHVLRTITTQLGALGCSLWRREEDSGLVAFAFAFEHGSIVMPTDPKVGPVSPALRIDDVWPWPEVFRTGKPYLLEDIREDLRFPWRDHVLALGVISILVVPMLVAGEVEGVIGIRFSARRTFSTDEMDLAQALANLAMLALQLTRLSVQNRSAAVLAERNRMARDIHDTLAQGFTGVIVQLEAAADASAKALNEEAKAHMLSAAELARDSLKEARRSVQALRPQALQDKTLCEALTSLVHTMTQGTALKAVFSVEGELPKLPAGWEENLLRIGQEVLTNTLRHAQARQFSVQLVFDPLAIKLILQDDGKGFDARRKHDGFGLLGIRERVTGMGGQLSIHSKPGAGTTIHVTLPYLANEHAAKRTLQ
jgi:PAS domain S-box-containing protein